MGIGIKARRFAHAQEIQTMSRAWRTVSITPAQSQVEMRIDIEWRKPAGLPAGLDCFVKPAHAAAYFAQISMIDGDVFVELNCRPEKVCRHR